MSNLKQYVKNKEVVFMNNDNKFIYETNVYSYYNNFFCLSKSVQYISSKEIKNIVRSFWKTPHIQICTDLFCAPKWWLIENGYTLYTDIKNKKNKKNEKQKT